MATAPGFAPSGCGSPLRTRPAELSMTPRSTTSLGCAGSMRFSWRRLASSCLARSSWCGFWLLPRCGWASRSRSSSHLRSFYVPVGSLPVASYAAGSPGQRGARARTAERHARVTRLASVAATQRPWRKFAERGCNDVPRTGTSSGRPRTSAIATMRRSPPGSHAPGSMTSPHDALRRPPRPSAKEANDGPASSSPFVRFVSFVVNETRPRESATRSRSHLRLARSFSIAWSLRPRAVRLRRPRSPAPSLRPGSTAIAVIELTSSSFNLACVKLCDPSTLRWTRAARRSLPFPSASASATSASRR